MIPASYFFRDAYDHHWTRPEKEETAERREDAPRPTIATLLADFIAGLPAPALRPSRHAR